jgi:uncharacterized membrane protein
MISSRPRHGLELWLTPLRACLSFYGMADKHYRSLIKAVSWRLTGSVDTLIISFLITGRIKWALTISGVELFTKIGLYYLHERVWDRLPFGRIPEPAKGKGSFEI